MSFFLVIQIITTDCSFNVIYLRRFVKTTEDKESTEKKVVPLSSLCPLW